ncbi:hypothetical protein FQN52_007859 [Onygenales sp. PD_12]|nr:hypothetical protein FQN52_007859 [Onygenales sp. PD_12]
MNRYLVAASLLLGTLQVSAVDFYVDTQGSDENAGSSPDEAFGTLERAQEAVRTVTSDAMNEDVTVHIAPGTYFLSAPLLFNATDSGQNGFTVNWIGQEATISGGFQIEGWESGSDGVFSASVPAGTRSRNLFVGGMAANYARTKLSNREDFTYTSTGMQWTDSAYDFLMTTEGVENAEIRFISSFTDRYAPIESVGDRELVMKQFAWGNQIIGYDTINNPNEDFGAYVQNCLAFLTDGGQFFFDSNDSKVYYKPLDGEDMETIDAYLGVLETLVAVGGTHDDPAHDISFSGLTFSHSTWLKPDEGFGYIDQQTGAHIGEDVSYPEFEATRPRWHQMPGAVQISAATNIGMVGCNFTQLGAGGLGIGNDANAHISGVGLGASKISITDGYFTQVQGNSITAGGILADAHHPSDPRMTNSEIDIRGNIFFNNSALYSSTVNILFTYLESSNITHNDISEAPYSGICHGYGWGANDAGGSVEYRNRGLYKYQPEYDTPTTIKDNLIEGNLIHRYGLTHTDLGAIYTLSRSPGTLVTDNYAYDSSGFGIYPDEGSSNITYVYNVCFPNGPWYAANDWSEDLHTGNNILTDNWGKSGDDSLVNQPDGTGRRGNTFERNYIVSDVDQTSARGQRAVYRAGVPPGARSGRPVSNQDDLADGYLSLGSDPNGDGLLAVRLTNFDGVDFTDVSFEVSAENGQTLEPVDTPTSIPADSSAAATYRVSGGDQNQVTVTAAASYKNPRTGKLETRSASGSVEL